jgi:hypothetical protein
MACKNDKFPHMSVGKKKHLDKQKKKPSRILHFSGFSQPGESFRDFLRENIVTPIFSLM